MYLQDRQDTICALSTPGGMGAIAVVRVSGPKAIDICDTLFSKSLASAPGYSLHFGDIAAGADTVDQVLITVFRGPRSYTGEDVVEISCHGSTYIQARLLELLVKNGCRLAGPGEFSLRAFANGKMDLSRTEAVADLIASSTKAAHKLAMNQMRGGFSKRINSLRENLIHFASLVELELDFSEEDVEFADRHALETLVKDVRGEVMALMDSFAAGNAIKNGVPVAIIGAPNVGKSTLLNALLGDDRAIVSATAGTTRDTIEDETTIDGVRFRFVDTAGIRDTTDEIENLGIARSFEQAGKAGIVLYLTDASEVPAPDADLPPRHIRDKIGTDQTLLIVGNKIDKAEDREAVLCGFERWPEAILISAERGDGIAALKEQLGRLARPVLEEGRDVVVTNARHYEALRQTDGALEAVQTGLDSGITGDFLAADIRRALHHLGEITGEITTDDLLGNIFSRFCIGK